jgi:hypothetical protein
MIVYLFLLQQLNMLETATLDGDGCDPTTATLDGDGCDPTVGQSLSIGRYYKSMTKYWKNNFMNIHVKLDGQFSK